MELSRLSAFRAPAKVGLIAAGYVGAFLAAGAAVAVHVAATSGPERQGSSGMYAFGDSLLFLAVFGMAAVLPTGGALVILRPYAKFWRVFSVVGPAVGVTGLLAGLAYGVAPFVGPGTTFYAWSAFAVLRLILAPLLALLFFLSGVFAPNRSARIALFVAAGFEAFGFACVLLPLFRQP